MPLEIDTAKALNMVSRKLWGDIQQAINERDKQKLEQIGSVLATKPLVQEGLTPEELAKQILDLAPGQHPQLGEMLLGLSRKLTS